jgi:hypothetical protein
MLRLLVGPGGTRFCLGPLGSAEADSLTAPSGRVPVRSAPRGNTSAGKETAVLPMESINCPAREAWPSPQHGEWLPPGEALQPELRRGFEHRGKGAQYGEQASLQQGEEQIGSD